MGIGLVVYETSWTCFSDVLDGKICDCEESRLLLMLSQRFPR